MQSIGMRLRGERQRRQLSQAALAAALNVSVQSISRWERDETVPQAHYRLSLCRFFDLAPEALFASLEEAIPTPRTLMVNVPALRTPIFTGREHLLERVRQHLQAQAGPCALSGLAGVGKTQAALEYVYRWSCTYQTVLWLEAEQRDVLLAEVMRVAEHLQLPVDGGRPFSAVMHAFHQWLTEHEHWLLVLDNLEDLHLLHELLPANPAGHVLLTMRSSVTGTIATALPVNTFSTEEGLLFLLRRAKRLFPTAPLEAAPTADLATGRLLVEALGGLPLALDQVGAYLEETGCTLEHYLDAYRSEHHHLLSRRGPTAMDHPASVMTTFTCTLRQVQQEDAMATQMLQLCAFLHPDNIPEDLLGGGQDRASSKAGVLAFDQAAHILRRFALIERDPEQRTVSIHRLVQVVVRAQLDEGDQHRWAQEAVQRVSASAPQENTWSDQWSHWLVQACMQVKWITHYQLCSLEAAQLLFVLATAYHERGLYQQALVLLQQARPIRHALLGEAHLDTAEIDNDLGVVYWYLGKYSQAEPLFQRALQVYAAQCGWEHPSTIHIMHNQAVLWLDQGNYAQAEDVSTRVLSSRIRLLGERHVQVAESLFTLGSLAYKQGQWERAETYYLQAYVLRQSLLGEDHPQIAHTVGGLARLYLQTGKEEQAQKQIQQAQQICERSLGVNHPRMTHYWQLEAELLLKQGQWEQAMPLLQRSLAIRQQMLPAEHPHLAATLVLLSDLSRQQGKRHQAQTYLHQAWCIQKQVLGDTHPETLKSWEHLKCLQQEEGDEPIHFE